MLRLRIQFYRDRVIVLKLIDLHCDTISCCMKEKDKYGLFRNDFNVDIEKLKKANSSAQFFAMFVDLEKTKDPLEACLLMADKFHQELEINKNYIKLAKNYEDIISNEKEDKISAFLTIEEGGVLQGSIGNLKRFYEMGVRLITLTWNYPNDLGFPNANIKDWKQGLTSFGKEVVQEMNSLGMLVDVSHLSDEGFYQVADISGRPFVASHSNARAVTHNYRNLTDDMIKLLAEKGGVMGINFEKTFLGNRQFSAVEDMVTHIKHIFNVGGAEVLAMGSDFDGINQELEIRDIGEIDKLINVLIKEGFTEGQLEKFLYKNALRVIKDVL